MKQPRAFIMIAQNSHREIAPRSLFAPDLHAPLDCEIWVAKFGAPISVRAVTSGPLRSLPKRSIGTILRQRIISMHTDSFTLGTRKRLSIREFLPTPPLPIR